MKFQVILLRLLLGGLVIIFPLSSIASEPKVETQALKQFKKALALSQKGQCDKALSTWKTLIQKYPKAYEVANNYAGCLMRLGQYAKANKVLEEALEAKPPTSDIWQNLNYIYAIQARQAYQKVIGDRPNKVHKPPKVVWVKRWQKQAFLPSTDQRVTLSNPFQAQVKAVVQAQEKWRKAWEHQKVRQYLRQYHIKFRPEGGLNRNEWAAQRLKNIKRPKKIMIQLKNLKATALDKKHVWVHAVQLYQSNIYQDKTQKAWLWYNDKNKGWQIIKETILPEL